MAWSNILNPSFFGGLGKGKASVLGVYFFDDRTRVIHCSHLVYSNDIQEINMSSNTCHF